MPAKAMSAEVEAALEEDVRELKSDDRLVKLRQKIAEVRDLEEQIDQTEERLDDLRRKRWAIVGHYGISGELVAMLHSAGVKSVSIEPQGNHPAYIATLKNIFAAKLPDDERRDAALKKFKWLQGLSKTQYKVDFGRGQNKIAKRFATMLDKKKLDYDVKVGVHSTTLTAEIRRRFSDGDPLSPAEMDLLGAAVYPTVELTKQEGLLKNGKGRKEKGK